jgi:type IV secretory pathway VirB2 component (pilin)
VSSPPEIVIHVTPAQGESAAPKQDGLDKLAQLLAGGYAVLTAVLTVIGGLKGGLGRILLNHPVWTAVGITSLLVAIFLALLSAHVVPTSGTKANNFLRLALVVSSLLLFGLGIGAFANAEFLVTEDNQRPTITTKTSISADSSTLEGHVTAAGIEGKEWIYVSVNGFQERSTATAQTKTKRSLLYQTRAGPNLEGDVDVDFTIGFIPAHFDVIRVGATLARDPEDEQVDPCFAGNRPAVDQSCATVYPPRGRRRPTLSASWEPGTGKNQLTIKVGASSLDPEGAVALLVARAPSGQIFYRSKFGPKGDGTVEVDANVSVPTSVRKVCVVATTSGAVHSCSLSELDLSRTSFLFTTSPPQ